MTCCPAPNVLGTPAASEGRVELLPAAPAGFAPLTCTRNGQSRAILAVEYEVAYKVNGHTTLYVVGSEGLFIFPYSSREDEALLIFRELWVLLGDRFLELFDGRIRVDRD